MSQLTPERRVVKLTLDVLGCRVLAAPKLAGPIHLYRVGERKGRAGIRLATGIGYVGGRRHLPVVELHEAP